MQDTKTRSQEPDLSGLSLSEFQERVQSAKDKAHARAEEAKKRGSALAEAIRLEIVAELSDGRTFVDFPMLAKIAQTAHHGRLLVSVRNPMTRFDARAMGAEPPADAYGAPYWEIVDEDDDDDGYAGAVGYDCMYPGQGSSWIRGPMAKHARAHEKKLIEDMVQKSPLAKALHVELTELAAQSPCTPSQLLELEQLASRGLTALEVSCGFPLRSSPHRGRRKFLGGVMANPNFGQAWAPSTSDETFGAAAIRALGAQGPTPPATDKVEIVRAIAAAKAEGLEDVAADLRKQLAPQPPPQAPPKALSANPKETV